MNVRQNEIFTESAGVSSKLEVGGISEATQGKKLLQLLKLKSHASVPDASDITHY